MEKKNLAVIASRLKCVDAISVEADKWIDKFSKLGYNIHLCAGKFGEPTNLPIFELPEMDYKHPEVRGIKRIMFGSKLDKNGLKASSILMNSLVKRIKGPLKNYLVTNKIQILCVEDALGSFKNLPFNIALSQIVAELGISTISRYHYLPWDNPYFTRYNNFPKILQNIPIKLKNVIHITNTENAKKELKEKRDIFSRVIPNTIDIAKLSSRDDYNNDFRKNFDIKDDQLIFLQPTRVKRNKFVERSIKIVSELNDLMKKDNVLLITGSPVYSRGNYFEEIVKKMNKQNVRVIFANDRIFLGRHENQDRKFYSIHDAYAHADVVLYPNTGDAFGNPVIEAAAYKKPLIVNSFPNLTDFKERGFQFVVIDQKVDNEVVSDAYQLISDKEKLNATAEHNFELLKTFYSSDTLDDALMPILNDFDNQKSFISRVAGMIPSPSSLWSGSGNKKKDFKDKTPNKSGKKKGPNMKNRKGGYKEPSRKR